MKISNLFKNLKFPPLIIAVICISLIVGIFFRFYHLDTKFYSYDETHTSQRVSGYYSREMFNEIKNQETIFSIDEFQKYQRPQPDKGIGKIVSGLSKEDPNHTPVYFILARFWSQLFQSFLNPVQAIRSFSAFCDLLSFVAMYLLCRELFNSSKVAAIGVALMAVSPFHILYGQYARPYSIFTTMVLFSSFSLLLAVRKKTFISWLSYTIISIFSFYTNLFTALVTVSHFIFVFGVEKLRLTKVLWSFILSSLVIFSSGFVWLSGTLSSNSQKGRIGGIQLFELSQVVKMHLLRITRVFVDTHNLGGIVRFESNRLLTNIMQGSLIAFISILVIYSIIYLIQKSSRREWLFVLSLIGVTGLVLGGIVKLIPSQMETRYYIPVYLGIQISVAYLLAQKIDKKSNLFSGIFIFLISLGIISGIISSPTQIWWINLPSSIKQAPQVVQAVNNADNPIIIWNEHKGVKGNWNTRVLLGISNKFDSDVSFFYLNKNTNLDELLSQNRSLFLYRPHQEIQKNLSERYELKPAYQEESEPWLWQLTSPNND